MKSMEIVIYISIRIIMNMNIFNNYDVCNIKNPDVIKSKYIDTFFQLINESFLVMSAEHE